MEHHHLVDPVDELGAEVGADLGHHRRLHAFVVVLAGEPLDDVGTQVGSHHDHRVAEIHGAALAIGEAAIVEHLEQHVEHVRMGLLHLIEQQHRIGPAAHRLGQVAALLVAHVAGRRADQPCHRVLLHELRHVDAHHGVLGVEQEFGERLAQLRLAHPGRPQKQEGAVGTVGIGQPGARTPHRVGHRGHRLALAQHPAVQGVFHVQQLFAVALQHLGHRDAGPLGDHLGDLLVGDLVAQQLALAGLGLGGRGQLAFQFGNLSVLQLAHARQVAGAARRVQLDAQLIELSANVRGALHRCLLCLPDLLEIRIFALGLGDLGVQLGQARDRFPVLLLLDHLPLHLELDQAPVEAIHLLGHGIDLHADPARRLVHQVDGLVRQLAIGNVALRQPRRGHDRGIRDIDAMVDLVALLEATQDGDGVLDAGLIHQHLLEAPLQRRVLLDVLAVFVERGRAHAVQLAARQRRLEHVAGVHGALGLAGTDHGVQFVDEQDHLPFFLGQLVEHRLETLLELAAELGAGDQRAHVQGQHALALEALGHFAVDDALGQPLDDRGLAHARFADQHRIVLGAPLQYLDGAANFVVAADHRIELAGTRPLGEVDGVFLQRLALAFGIRTLHGFSSTHARTGALELLLLAKAIQDCGELVVIEGGQQHRLHRDELIALLLRQLVGQIQQTHRIGGNVGFSGGVPDHRLALELGFQFAFQPGQIEAGLGEQRTRHAPALAQQCRQQMHRLDGGMVAADGQRLGIGDRFLQGSGETLLTHDDSIPNGSGTYLGRTRGDFNARPMRT